MSSRQQPLYQGLIAAGYFEEHMPHSKNNNTNPTTSNAEEISTSDAPIGQPVKKEKKSIFPWSKKKKDKDKDKKKDRDLPNIPSDVVNFGLSQLGVTPLNSSQVQPRRPPARNHDQASFRGVELSLVKTWGPESLYGIDLTLDPSELEGIVNNTQPRPTITRQAVRPFADDTASMYEEPTDFFDDGSPPQHPRPQQWTPPQSWHVRQTNAQSASEDTPTQTSKSSSSVHSHSRANSQSSSMYLFRIFRPNDTFGTVSCSLGCTTKSLVGMVTKKFHITDPSKYNLIFRRNESEIVLKSNEKPVELFIQLLIQLGYTDPKELIDLNREDLSHIGKFILREAALSHNLAVQSLQAINEEETANMWGQNLETVPISLYKIADMLKTLDLSKNPRLDFPLDFAQLCSSITKLSLARNHYSKIPESVPILQTLRVLDLSSNLIETLDGAELHRLQMLDQLYLWNNQLTSIPPSLVNLDRLTVLSLSNNCLSSIPQSLFRLINLRTLDLSFNSITSIPQEISQLVNLTHLSISSNQLKGRLSSAISKLEKLIEIDIRRNDITNIDSITNLSHLEHLYCDYNSITQAELKLPRLCYLSLNNNDQLNKFLAHCSMNYLTILDLSQCSLSQLRSSFFSKIPYIVQIKLDDNELKELPIMNHETLKHLEMFSCNRNVISQIPDTIFNLPKLNALDLHSNQIRTIPQGIWFAKLNYLNLSSNELDQFPVPPNLNPTPTMLPLPIKSPPNATIKNQPPKVLALPSYLEYLILADNRLTEDVFQPISLFKKLTTLNLALNQIFEVPPQAFYHFVDLHELNLSGNHLSNFMVEDLDRLKSLKILNLNCNKLTTLPSELSKLLKLNYFDVSCNNLKYNIYNWEYDWNWNWNPNLKYLNLSGNKRLQIQYNITGDGANYIAEFNRLNNLKILGLMDVTVHGMVNLPDETSSRRVRTAASVMNGLTYGVADRLSNTDDILAWDLAFPKFRDQDDECLYGLMDTIPARNVPDIEEVGKKLHDSFQSTFLNELSKRSKGSTQEDEIMTALRGTFLTLQRDVMAHCSASSPSATSMTIIYLKGSNLYLANVGDVQALLGQRGGRYKVLTELHVPGLPNMSQEITRVRQTGGYISSDGFVNGEVSLSRCFGAFSHLPIINANPYLSNISLSGEDEFIIMAGRGVWEVITHDMAVNIVRMEKRDYMIAAQKIKDLAVAYGAKRHIMVMIIGLNQLAYLRRRPTRKIKGHKLGPGFSIDLPSFDPSEALGVSLHKSKKSRKPIREEDIDLTASVSIKREIEPPTGQLALVMTDIKNSTNLWEIVPQGMQEGIKKHNEVMRHYLNLYGGYEVKTEGDAFIVSFSTVTSALLWCVTVQLELLNIDWPSEILATDDGREVLDPNSENRRVLYRGLSVRMGMNFGSPLCDQNIITGRMDYYGPMVNRASRVSSAADGGELCISSDVVSELMTIPGLFDFEEDGPKNSSPEIAEKHLGQLNEKMQQEIMGLKKLGLRLICLGVKKLKGLETPETLYMVYPKVLVGRSNPGIRKNATRLRTYSFLFNSTAPEMEDQLPIILKFLGPLCIRLENLARYYLRPTVITVSPPNSPTTTTASSNFNEFTDYFIKQFHQTLNDMSEDNQVGLLHSLIGRIENSISTLTLCHNEVGHWEQMLDQITSLLQSGIQQLEDKKALKLISNQV